MTVLETQLLSAHEHNDISLLSSLYVQAANKAGDIEASAFYLTHAYVFALEAGLQSANTLRVRLIDMGRDVPN